MCRSTMHLVVQTPLLVAVPQGSVLGPVLFVMHAIIKQQAVITSRVCISGLLLFFFFKPRYQQLVKL